MANKYQFGNKTIFEPGAFARTVSGIPAGTVGASSGNVMIIDRGLGKSWGGGSGINGDLSSKKKSIYEFSDIDEFRSFINGGPWLDLATILFNPTPNANGVSKLLFVAAKTTTKATIGYTFNQSSTGAGAVLAPKMKAVSIAITAGGTGYAVNDTITLTGGTFTQAIQVRVTTVSSGVVTGVSFVQNGSYSALPTNPVAQGSTSGSGTGATFTPTWGVGSVTVTSGGTNYGQVTLAFSGGTPTTAATAVATISGGAITTVSLTNNGSGYTAVPTLNITVVTTGGTLSISPRTEGEVANGIIVDNNLSKGFAAKMRAGTVDTTKFVIDFYKGTYRGAHTLDLNQSYTEWSSATTYGLDATVVYGGIIYKSLQASNTNQNPVTATTYWTVQTEGVLNFLNSSLSDKPVKITSSTEFSNLNEFITWSQNDAAFINNFVLTTSLVGNGTVVSADLTSYTGFNLASGGTESYNSQDFDDVIDNIDEEDYTFILSNDYGTNAQSVQNSTILAHILNDAMYDKYLFIGGGNTEAFFESQSVASAQYFDSSRVQVIHSGVKVNKVGGGTYDLPSIYNAAKMLGRIAGLAPQVPATWKNISINSPLHELSKKQRERAFDTGVMHLKYIETLGWVINQNVNTLQKNNQLVNLDGQSYEGTIERIKAQLNKELEINVRLNFVGKNLATANPADVKTFVEGYLLKQVASQSGDNQGGLIIFFRNVKVTTTQDRMNISYEFGPNGPINNILITGIILDTALSA